MAPKIDGFKANGQSRHHYWRRAGRLGGGDGSGAPRISGHSARIAESPWRPSRLICRSRHRPTARTIDRFWGLILTSALNETPDRLGQRYARKVFVDAFLRHRRGFEVEIPTVPLGRLYGEELQRWFQRHHVDIRFNSAVK